MSSLYLGASQYSSHGGTPWPNGRVLSTLPYSEVNSARYYSQPAGGSGYQSIGPQAPRIVHDIVRWKDGAATTSQPSSYGGAAATVTVARPLSSVVFHGNAEGVAVSRAGTYTTRVYPAPSEPKESQQQCHHVETHGMGNRCRSYGDTATLRGAHSGPVQGGASEVVTRSLNPEVRSNPIVVMEPPRTIKLSTDFDNERGTVSRREPARTVVLQHPVQAPALTLTKQSGEVPRTEKTEKTEQVSKADEKASQPRSSENLSERACGAQSPVRSQWSRTWTGHLSPTVCDATQREASECSRSVPATPAGLAGLSPSSTYTAQKASLMSAQMARNRARVDEERGSCASGSVRGPSPSPTASDSSASEGEQQQPQFPWLRPLPPPRLSARVQRDGTQTAADGPFGGRVKTAEGEPFLWDGPSPKVGSELKRQSMGPSRSQGFRPVPQTNVVSRRHSEAVATFQPRSARSSNVAGQSRPPVDPFESAPARASLR
eukprot:RCo022441